MISIFLTRADATTYNWGRSGHILLKKQQQQPPRMGQPMQQHGLVSSAEGSSTAGSHLTDQEKKDEKERFLMFTRVLMK